MPRFYIDSDDGDRSFIDPDGFDLPNAETARYLAMDALPDMVREKLPDGDHRRFTVTVRDQTGTTLYKATLSLIAEWTDA